MCGIYGYVGKLDAYNEVFNGLKLLQYRGYDSCGIAYLSNNELKIVKTVGTIDNLPKIKIKCNLSFGHTRWATNGAVNYDNTHPHISFDKRFTVVHNGIIYNANEIKLALQNKGINFYSNTDTEVIANLLASLNGDVDERIKSLFNHLKGTFALIIENEGALYLVKKFSPLNILKAEDGIYISSDVSSLKTGQLYSLKDYDVIKIKDNQILPLSGEIAFTKYNNCIQNYSLNNFPHFMLKEIYETPTAIENTYNYLKDIDVSPYFKNIKDITLIGCGTAYHSCLIGGEVLKKLNFNIKTELASNFTLFKKINKHHLHIIVSQSGETADCIKAAENIKKFGGKILVITNEAKSSIVKFANHIILTKAQKELAVASTKTYCSQVFAFILIAKKLKNANYTINIKKFKKSLTNYIKNSNIISAAKMLSKLDKTILIGKDIDYLTLLEASLKIREIDYIYTIPIYSGELKHGTLSLIDNQSIVLSLNTDNVANKLSNAINEIESRGGKVIKFEQFMPKKYYKDFSCIYSIIPFQLFSYFIAIEKGYNPDMPKNLAKSVTVE